MTQSGERKSGPRGVELGRGRDKAERPVEKAGRRGRAVDGANGPKARKGGGNPFLFFLFQFSKAIFQNILNSLLYLK
jgi:hypothetical protein